MTGRLFVCSQGRQKGQILLRYTFDPVSIPRVLYLDGPEAPAVPPVRKLVTRLPELTEPQVLARRGWAP